MKIDFDRIIPKYQYSTASGLASIVTDSEHVDFFLEECERYGIRWAGGEFPTDYNPLHQYPDDVFFRFSLFDNRRGESGRVEMTFDSSEEPETLDADGIPLEELVIDNDEIHVSSEVVVPLDLSTLFPEVSA